MSNHLLSTYKTSSTKSKQFFYQNVPLKEVVGNFLEYIQFHKIPANVLMREIHPLGLVPYSIIMNALAYQVNNSNIEVNKVEIKCCKF